MVKNIWKNMTLLCSNHAEPTQLILNSKYQYECQKCCGNAITLSEFEKAIDHLDQCIQNNELNLRIDSLQGEKWKDRSKPIYYEVKSGDSTTGTYVLSVENRKAIRSSGKMI